MWASEYTTKTELVFRPNADGDLRLDTIVSEDGGSLSPESAKERDRWVDAQRKKLDAIDCQAKTP
jgi:hypothetical protein